MRAEGNVYRNIDTGQGYVGRSPRGTCELVARKGQELTEEQVQELGLTDLADHTDYDAVMAEAAEKGAHITVRDEATGAIMSVPAGGAA